MPVLLKALLSMEPIVTDYRYFDMGAPTFGVVGPLMSVMNDELPEFRLRARRCVRTQTN